MLKTKTIFSMNTAGSYIVQLTRQGGNLLTLLLFSSISVWSCQNTSNQDVVEAAKAYQTTIDENLSIIELKRIDIQDQINVNTYDQVDTFELAKQLVPLKKASFLLNTTHDRISRAISAYENETIDADSLSRLVQESRDYVDTLMVQHDFEY